MVNYPGPYEARFYYTTTPVGLPAITHRSSLNLDLFEEPEPGTPFSEIYPLLDNGTHADSLETISEAWGNLWAQPLSDDAGNTVDRCELWKIEPESYEASFISAHTLAIPGTDTGASANSTQMILTFRTKGGSIAKLNIMESVYGGNLPDTPPLTSADLQAIADAFSDGSFPWIGRDNTFPFVFLALYPGQNEAMFKKRFRNL